ncbi:MAG TPA: TetR/AcrR family transcriptional regulator [Chroococcales cyanobacterium]
MARPRSEEKRNTLLSAATKVFATNGLSASTASITNAAGLAEGTLFIYFKGKDELINTLYEEIKSELAEAMLAGYPNDASVQDRIRHVWQNYVDWGLTHHDRLEVLHKIKVWEGLKPEVRESTALKYCQLHSLIESAIAEKLLQDIPLPFIFATLSAQAETTMQFMKQHPEQSELYKEKGFEIFWNGIARSTS